jgi:nitrogen fixation NifU-like protein
VSDLRELYQQVILDHSRAPRNFRALTLADRTARGHNPLCGDEITLSVTLRDGAIAEVGFQGSGCAISKASASLMTEAVKGKTSAEVRALFEKFRRLVGADTTGPMDPAELGRLAALSGVREFPVRVKCATLAWHTLQAALEGADTPVSTESV